MTHWHEQVVVRHVLVVEGRNPLFVVALSKNYEGRVLLLAMTISRWVTYAIEVLLEGS